MLCKDLLIVLSGIVLWQNVQTEVDVSEIFRELHEEILDEKHETAQIAWDTIFDPFNPRKALEAQQFSERKRAWSAEKCSQLRGFSLIFNRQQRRTFNLLCRGPKFSRHQQQKLLALSNEIENVYTATRLCVPKTLSICAESEKLWNLTFVEWDDGTVSQVTLTPDRSSIELKSMPVNTADLKCFSGEPDMENLMANDYSSVSSEPDMCLKHNNEINYWIWEAWRVAVGPRIKVLYPHLVQVMNEAARKDHFKDIGDVWQTEMELGEDVEGLMSELMLEVQPLYNMLHAFIRSVLEKHHKVSFERDLPAHLLGWNSNWYHLFKQYVEPEFFKTSDWNMDKALKNADWDQSKLLKRIEDFYTAMGLPRMSNAFWNRSVIDDEKSLSCHGTAADMFAPGDFRMIVCGCKNLYDFYVIIHEMGHIEQYLLAQNQPAIFRAGNSIVQETIGDSAFLAMMTPIHLNRMRLIEDVKLFPSANNDFDLHQLMMMAFMKLPEIPFGYVFEKFRYDLFADRVGIEQSNDYFWDLTRKYQRVEPPNLALNRHDLFDAAAKFHLAANVPYARYFFANILQYQVYRALCEKTFYARLNTNQTLPLPLHKCDMYGSKRAGTLLKKALQPGSSQNLKSILKTLTGEDKISADALMEYYKPLTVWLQTYLHTNEIEY